MDISMSTICFISNQTKTIFYKKIATALINKGIKVCWIAVNKKMATDLQQIYGFENVLYLPLSTSFAGEPFDIKINDLLFADRRLKYIPEKGKRYLCNIQHYIKDFLIKNDVIRIVGEQTYAYECVTFRLSKKYLPECQWLSPYPSRYPAGSFSFYSDESFSREVFQSIKVNKESLKNNDVGVISKDAEDYKEAIKLYIQEGQSWKVKLQKILRFFNADNYDANDPTWKSNTRLDKLKKNIKHYFNLITYKIVPKVTLENLSHVSGNKIVFPLHLQPELNIDTAGRYFDNQQQTIIDIWRQLGPNDVLYIKEHPIAIGNRSFLFYHRLLKLPNIKLLEHSCDVKDLLSKVDYVFTISGTMGMEAALLGKKVFCLAPTTYNRLKTVAVPTINDYRQSNNLQELYQSSVSREGAWSVDDFKCHMEKYAFQGDAEGDLTGNPKAWESSNIDMVTNAILGTLIE